MRSNNNLESKQNNSGVARLWSQGGHGVWGMEVPQRSPGAEPRRGSGAKPPEARYIQFAVSDALLHTQVCCQVRPPSPPIPPPPKKKLRIFGNLMTQHSPGRDATWLRYSNVIYNNMLSSTWQTNKDGMLTVWHQSTNCTKNIYRFFTSSTDSPYFSPRSGGFGVQPSLCTFKLMLCYLTRTMYSCDMCRIWPLVAKILHIVWWGILFYEPPCKCSNFLVNLALAKLED